MTLEILKKTYAICRHERSVQVPAWLLDSEFVSITRTSDELSIVCADEQVPPSAEAQRGWRLIRVQGKIDFSVTGVMASIAQPLADAQISMLPIATYDTDYILVKSENLERAVLVLKSAGFHVM